MNQIEIINISKKYKLYKRPADRLKDWLTPEKYKFHQEFWALKDINFTVQRGISLGIIGVNGAGKSTLLKILSNTTVPTKGICRVNGRFSALLELGTGFHPDFTGMQNIFMNGKLLGMSDQFLHEKINSIAEFSELGDFINRPLRTYSTGMVVRLAFSIAAAVDPDILIIDEALAVGDIHFQQKCIKRIKQFKDEGKTILFVSHDMGIIQNLCNEAILLDEGQLADWGKPDEIIDHYNALIARRSAKNISLSIERVELSKSQKIVQRSGNFLALISEVELFNSKREPASVFISGENVQLVLKIFFYDYFKNPTIGIQIKDRLGQPVFGINTYILKHFTGEVKAGDTITAQFSFPLNIGEGGYTFTIAAHTEETHLEECFDWADKILSIQVLSDHNYKFYGLAKIPVCVETSIKSEEPGNLENLISTLFKDTPSSITMGMEYQKYLCKGWYMPQGTSGSEERWTDKEFAFFIKLDGSKLQIESTSYKPDQHINPIKADIFIDNQKVGKIEINSTNYQTFQFNIPDNLKGKIGFVKGILEQAWSPNFYDSSNTDNRILGILVKGIKVV